jgi:flagellar L-ring protein precursor FlgH
MRRGTLTGIAVVLLFSSQAWTQVSLWTVKEEVTEEAADVAGRAAPAKEDKANVLREVKSRSFKIHDIVSIVVSLAAEASTDEQAAMEKKTDPIEFQVNRYLKLHKSDASMFGFDLQGKSPVDLGMDMTSDKKFKGDGTSDRKDTLRTRLAAEIMDIKPNGNLVIEAKHTFTKQREKTSITVSGVVRPQDVGPDNTVYSYNVADADIKYESTGPVTDANERGWLSRILDKLWPF